MADEKRTESEMRPSGSPDESSESGPDDKAYSEKMEQAPGIRWRDQERDVEADGIATTTEIAEVEGGYHNFQPIADLQLEDWRKTEKRITRVLDFTLLPTLWVTYLNNYLDRTNISQAMTAGLDEDLNLGEDDFNTALSLLTVGYMLAQLPSNLLLTRVRPSIYLPCTVLVWSAVSACTAAATNAQTLFVIRFFLGITEAPLFPGVSVALPRSFKMSC